MEKTFSTISDLKTALRTDESLQTEFKEDPVKAINEISMRPLDYDVWIYRIVVIALGIGILAIVIGVIILIGVGEINDDKSVPTILTAIGSGAIGALAGLLAPSPRPAK
jgi:hypothetical protein